MNNYKNVAQDMSRITIKCCMGHIFVKISEK